MSAFNWERFLRQWSQEILKSMSFEQLAQLPPMVIESGWLGYPGATEEQVCQTESRLGVKLPPSYREFLKVTNGWRQTTTFIRRLWSTEDIERFAARHQKWIESFTRQYENTDVSFDYAIELDELWEAPSVADEAYFIYGEEQDCSKLRVEYLKTAIEISDVGDSSSIYLLNPQVVNDEGEWEAWFFGDWLPGADRYPSFQAMMVAEYQNFLELSDSASVQSESVTVPTPAIAEPFITDSVLSTATLPIEGSLQESFIHPMEATSETTPEVWRSLKRLLIEFQTRQIGEQPEYRTVAMEGAQINSWYGLGEQSLPQWLQEQLTGSISSPVNAVAASVARTVSSVEPHLISPFAQAKPALTLSLELDQLAIRQDSRLSAQIIVKPDALKQTKRTEHASLVSQQPFSLEVVFHLQGQLSELPTQPVTYQTQFHAQNRMTGQWIALGETRPDALVSDRQTYTAYLFGNTLEPGMYRLQVLTTLKGAANGLTSFELPLLNVV